jgi:hypothetical protein
MPAGVINTGNHPKLLWPGIKTIWGQVYAEHAEEYTDLYEVDSSEKAYEQDVELTGFDIAPIKPEGQSGTYDSEIQGAITTTAHIAYALGYIVTQEELDDNLYEQVAGNRAKSNAFAMRQTIENVAAFLYNNAFSTTYFTTGDGAALSSASHVLPLGGTYSNILSTSADLSEVALEDLCIQIYGAQNNRGLQISLMPKSLIVPRQLWFTANRILKSIDQSNTMSNNVNVLRVTNAIPEGIKMNHYLTDATNWYVRTNCPNGMKFYWRKKPDLAMDNDFDTKNAKALSYMRFSVTCTDPRGLYASAGS